MVQRVEQNGSSLEQNGTAVADRVEHSSPDLNLSEYELPPAFPLARDLALEQKLDDNSLYMTYQILECLDHGAVLPDNITPELLESLSEAGYITRLNISEFEDRLARTTDQPEVAERLRAAQRDVMQLERELLKLHHEVESGWNKFISKITFNSDEIDSKQRTVEALNRLLGFRPCANSFIRMSSEGSELLEDLRQRNHLLEGISFEQFQQERNTTQEIRLRLYAQFSENLDYLGVSGFNKESPLALTVALQMCLMSGTRREKYERIEQVMNEHVSPQQPILAAQIASRIERADLGQAQQKRAAELLSRAIESSEISASTKDIVQLLKLPQEKLEERVERVVSVLDEMKRARLAVELPLAIQLSRSSGEAAQVVSDYRELMKLIQLKGLSREAPMPYAASVLLAAEGTLAEKSKRLVQVTRSMPTEQVNPILAAIIASSPGSLERNLELYADSSWALEQAFSKRFAAKHSQAKQLAAQADEEKQESSAQFVSKYAALVKPSQREEALFFIANKLDGLRSTRGTLVEQVERELLDLADVVL